MRSVNKVVIIGNLTRDPEMRQTPNGQSVATYGVATNREWMTKDGDRKSSAEFHECVAWARLAEICANYLKKGNLVYVEGYLKTRSWETPEGVKKFKTEIVVQDMIMLDKRRDNGEADESDDSYIPQEDIVDNEYEDVSSEEPTQSTEAVTETEQTAPAETPVEEQAPKQEENPIDKDLGL